MDAVPLASALFIVKNSMRQTRPAISHGWFDKYNGQMGHFTYCQLFLTLKTHKFSAKLVESEQRRS